MKLHERWILLIWLGAVAAPWFGLILLQYFGGGHSTAQIFVKPEWMFGALLQLELFLVVAFSLSQFGYLSRKGTMLGKQAWLQCFLFLCSLSLLFPAARLGNITPHKAALLQTNVLLFSLALLLLYAVLNRRCKTAAHFVQGLLLAWCVLPAALAYVRAEFSGKPIGESLRWSPLAFNHALIQGGTAAMAQLHRSMVALLVAVSVMAAALFIFGRGPAADCAQEAGHA